MPVGEDVRNHRDDMIRTFFSEGSDVSSLSKVFCISKTEVRRIIAGKESENHVSEQTFDKRKDRVARAKELHESGKNRKAIANEMDVHVKTVDGYLNAGKTHRFLKPEQWLEGVELNEKEKARLDLLFSLYRKGDSQSSLARKAKMSACMANRLFKKFGLNKVFGIDEDFVRKKLSASSRKAQKGRKTRSEKNRKRVYSLIDAGNNIDCVMKKTGLSSATIRKYIRERKAEIETQNR